jgi:hypothetical protein
MSWSIIEHQPSPESSAIFKYHTLTDQVLHWRDRPMLARLESDVIKENKGDRLARHFYLGWLAYEAAAVAERHGQMTEAINDFERARLAWTMLDIAVKPWQTLKKLRTYQALSLLNFRHTVAIERSQRPEPSVVDPAELRDYLAELTGRAYLASLKGGETAYKHRGLATELLFSSLMLESVARGEKVLVPFVAAPRVDIPRHYYHEPGVTDNDIRAYDAELQSFDPYWHPQQAYHVQLKTSYSDETHTHYDQSKVTLIYADAHMHVASVEDGLSMVQALITPERSVDQGHRINNALQNIYDELESGPVF